MQIDRRMLGTCLGLSLLCATASGTVHAEGTAKSTQGTVPAAVTAPDASAARKLDELLKLSDNHELLHDLDMVQDMLEKLDELEEAKRLTKAQSAPIRIAVKKSLAGPTLQAAFRARLLARFDAANVDTLLTYYRSPLGKRYGSAGSEDPKEETMNAWFEKTPPSAARIARVHAMLEAANAYAGLELMMLSPARGVTKAMLPLAPPGTALPSDAAIDAQLKPMLDMLKPEVDKTIAYVMRDFSDAELDGFIAFEKTPAARWYHGIVFKEAGLTMEEAFGAVGKALAESLAKKK